MASRRPKPSSPAKSVAPSAVPEGGITPPPPAILHVTLMTLPRGQVLHRVHQEKYAAAQFNPGVQGNARFSPIRNDLGEPIPTLYAGTSFPCVLMESVFHDVPHTAGFKSFDKNKLAGQIHSELETTCDLQLVDLSSVALRKLGVPRKQLIDTGKDQYPATRQWAEAIHRQCPEAQGLNWVSRQDDSAQAFMLFGDRLPATGLRPRGNSRNILKDEDTYDEVLDLADRIGVSVVPGKM
jgi:hypothetical protein